MRKPLTPIVLGAFFLLASLICLTAGVTLLAPETPLRSIWSIKPAEYRQLLALAPWSGIGFLLLATVMAGASFGSFKRLRWGWRLAIGVFAINGAADAARMLSGDMLEGAIGAIIATAIVIGLSQRSVRNIFDH